MFDPQSQNSLLAKLPERTRKQWSRHLRRRFFRHREILGEPGNRYKDVYFPLTAIISLLSVVEGDRTVEAITVGNEGFVGVPVVLGRPFFFARALCQMPGDCLTMPAEALHRLLMKDRQAADVFAAYADFLLAVTFRNLACTQHHDVTARCARWLLVTFDRGGTTTVPYTHNLLASMLGVTRPRVTETIRLLDREGVLTAQRGSITLTDRRGLERQACECYRYVNQLTQLTKRRQ